MPDPPDWRDFIVPYCTPAADPLFYNPSLDPDGNVLPEPPAPPWGGPPPAPVTTVADDFGGPALGAAWSTVGGNWSQTGGVLAQTGLPPDDPQKALCGAVVAADGEVTARVRVDLWNGGDRARAGVALNQSPDGGGYNLLLRDGSVQFLDDFTAWGASVPYPWKPGEWHRFRLRRQGSTLSGKVWPDGTPEPAGWTLTQADWPRRGPGCPGLNGGSGGCTVSFAGFTFASLDPPPKPDDSGVPIEGWYVKGTATQALVALARVQALGSDGAKAELGIDDPTCAALVQWGRAVGVS